MESVEAENAPTLPTALGSATRSHIPYATAPG